MSGPVTYDPAYRERVAQAVMSAIMVSSIAGDGEERTAVIRSAEVIDVLVAHIALYAATSPAMATPSSRRDLCEGVRKKLFRQIGEALTTMERDGSPFDHVISGRMN